MLLLAACQSNEGQPVAESDDRTSKKAEEGTHAKSDQSLSTSSRASILADQHGAVHSELEAVRRLVVSVIYSMTA